MNPYKLINKVCYAFFIAMFIMFAVSGLAQIFNSITIDSEGNITHVTVTVAGVLIFEDAELSISLTQINWGTIVVDRSVDTDSIAQYTFYMVNSGNATGEYEMNVINWNMPEAEAAITVTWDITGVTIEPNQSIPVTLTLSISPQISYEVTNFSFDIVISANKIQ